jgi:hypothetical protein
MLFTLKTYEEKLQKRLYNCPSIFSSSPPPPTPQQSPHNSIHLMPLLIFYCCSCSNRFTIPTNSVARVHERTILTKRPPLVGEVIANFLVDRGLSCGQCGDPYGRNLGFLDRSCYFFFQVAPQL